MSSGQPRPPRDNGSQDNPGPVRPALPARPNLPPRPERPVVATEDPTQVKRRGCLAMLMAGMVVLLCLVGLAFLSQGYMIPVTLIAGGVFLYVFFHYIVWGWWLGNLIREEARQEAEAKAALQKAENPPR